MTSGRAGTTERGAATFARRRNLIGSARSATTGLVRGLPNSVPLIFPSFRTRGGPVRAIAAIAILVCALPPRALAHGGAYNPAGSGTTVPAPATGAPAGPSPSTGFPMPNSVPTGAVLRRESWEDWWHFNKDPYLELKRAVSTEIGRAHV